MLMMVSLLPLLAFFFLFHPATNRDGQAGRAHLRARCARRSETVSFLQDFFDFCCGNQKCEKWFEFVMESIKLFVSWTVFSAFVGKSLFG